MQTDRLGIYSILKLIYESDCIGEAYVCKLNKVCAYVCF